MSMPWSSGAAGLNFLEAAVHHLTATGARLADLFAAGQDPAVPGILYTAGALAYHRRRPDPRPSVFGYHEVFHTFVWAAATCQYLAIALFIV